MKFYNKIKDLKVGDEFIWNTSKDCYYRVISIVGREINIEYRFSKLDNYKRGGFFNISDDRDINIHILNRNILNRNNIIKLTL